MNPDNPKLPRNVRVIQLSPKAAAAMRQICTGLRFHERCIYRVCRRHRRCSTEEVVCYQLARNTLKPLIQRANARRWAMEPPDDVSHLPPVAVTSLQNRAAWRKLREEKRKLRRDKRRQANAGIDSTTVDASLKDSVAFDAS